jgi:hypothetical protein
LKLHAKQPATIPEVQRHPTNDPHTCNFISRIRINCKGSNQASKEDGKDRLHFWQPKTAAMNSSVLQYIVTLNPSVLVATLSKHFGELAPSEIAKLPESNAS